ncbi:MAG: cation diffusion facilitator family transporter [Trueperaceae bacterium]|nr:cation diffusion facilitator family transporter [Trueperaceae bacterium]
MPNAHDHGVEQTSDRRILGTVALNGLLTVAQVIGGLVSGSVSLLADALHNLNDAMALVIVWIARRIGRRRADETRTFGYDRARTVGALINLVALAVVALFLAYESILRLLEPREVGGWTMIIVAGVALLVDVATVALLYGMRRGGTDVRAAFVHNVSDALASVAVMVGGAAILLSGWYWVDPLLSLAIVGYVAWQVSAMLPETVRVLMESAPPDLDVARVGADLRDVEGVEDVHHLHAWLMDEQRVALEAHLVIGREVAPRLDEVAREARRRLREGFDIRHATLEIEFPGTAAEEGHRTTLIAGDCCGPAADSAAGAIDVSRSA